jgi:hypothetical protein
MPISPLAARGAVERFEGQNITPCARPSHFLATKT